MIRVGLIGFGLAGRVFHAPLISSVAGLELAAVLEPLDAEPIIQPLHGQVDFLMNLQLDHGQAALPSRAQNVDHSAIH